MQKHTSTILTMMIGLLFGRLVTLHDLGIMELTGLSLLAICHRSEIWDGIQRFASRPAVCAYTAPRSAQVHGLVLSFRFAQRLAITVALVFGGLMLILDATHRYQLAK